MVAIARESLNISDNSGSIADPLWSGIGGPGSKPVVLMIGWWLILPSSPVLLGSLIMNWFTLDSGPLTDVDISLWLFSIPLLVKFTSFLSTLRSPEGLNEMGKFGVSYLELLILFEKWVGHRLLPEKTVPFKRRPGRPVYIGTPPVSKGVQIRLECQFLGSLFRSLGNLPGGLSRFIPGSLGTHLCRLSHLGWLQCSHGLTCRPLESSMPDCSKPLLDLLWLFTR